MECLFCGRKCRGKSGLEEHYRKHTNEFPFFCQKCPKEFSSKRSLNYHLERHRPRKEREMKCPLCEKKFLCKSYLKLHVSSHNGQKNFECKICGKKFAYPSGLAQHASRHKNINAFACSICPKAFTDKWILKHHEQGVHGIKRHKCHICEKMFSEKGNLSRHLKQHNPQRERFQCDKCPQSYMTKAIFEDHQLTHQGKEYSFQCDKCKQRFLSSRGLNEHTKRIHLDKAHIFSCVFCEKQSPNFSSFQRHTVSHTHERSYFCKLCPAEYCEERSVRLHYKIAHSRKREYFKCEMCPKSFLSKRSLNDHIRQHVGELHFQCQRPGCGMQFDSDSKRKRHFLNAHVGKQVSCTVCAKKFLTKGDLKYHVVIHSDVKGHQCILCVASFKWKRNLTQHQQTVHSKK